MSYALEITPNAQSELITLDLWLQEEAVDELDRLCLVPESLARVSDVPGLAHDFVRNDGRTRHYVFLVVRRDDARR